MKQVSTLFGYPIIPTDMLPPGKMRLGTFAAYVSYKVYDKDTGEPVALKDFLETLCDAMNMSGVKPERSADAHPPLSSEPITLEEVWEMLAPYIREAEDEKLERWMLNGRFLEQGEDKWGTRLHLKS